MRLNVTLYYIGCVEFILCCVGRGLCDELITRPGSPIARARACVCVYVREREREAAYARVGLLHHRKILLKLTQSVKYIIKQGWGDGVPSRTRNPHRYKTY